MISPVNSFKHSKKKKTIFIQILSEYKKRGTIPKLNYELTVIKVHNRNIKRNENYIQILFMNIA